MINKPFQYLCVAFFAIIALAITGGVLMHSSLREEINRKAEEQADGTRKLQKENKDLAGEIESLYVANIKLWKTIGSLQAESQTLKGVIGSRVDKTGMEGDIIRLQDGNTRIANLTGDSPLVKAIEELKQESMRLSVAERKLPKIAKLKKGPFNLGLGNTVPEKNSHDLIVKLNEQPDSKELKAEDFGLVDGQIQFVNAWASPVQHLSQLGQIEFFRVTAKGNTILVEAASARAATSSTIHFDIVVEYRDVK